MQMGAGCLDCRSGFMDAVLVGLCELITILDISEKTQSELRTCLCRTGMSVECWLG